MRHLSTRLGAGGLVTVALIAGLQAASSAGAPPFAIDWTPCADAPAVQCGTVQVPVDWARPAGPRVPIAVSRRPADNAGARIGTLFYNPGGPGDGGARYVRDAGHYFSAAVLTRFDLVALDPRGMGDSVKPQCAINPITPATTLFPRTESQFEQLRSHNREVGRDCLRRTGALMRNMDTVTVARDHEALRLALGVPQISWLGISYGTQLAANYAEMFPRRTRAIVLDATLEHSQAEGVQVLQEVAAQEDSFNRFARWCDTAPSCELRGQDVAAVYDRLVAAAEAHPIPADGALRAVTGEDIRMGTIRFLTLKEPSIYGPDASWGGLSRFLAAALAGHAEAFAVAPPADVPQTGFQSILGNACGDYVPQIGTWTEMQRRIDVARRLAPHLQGASELWRAGLCIGWPIPAANPPRLLEVSGVPALVVHAVHDSSDPYLWAHSLAAQIRGSRLLTRTGDGHTSYYTSSCARAAIDAFLVHPEPGPDGVCDQ